MQCGISEEVTQILAQFPFWKEKKKVALWGHGFVCVTPLLYIEKTATVSWDKY
jgi:hypothetical protein